MLKIAAVLTAGFVALASLPSLAVEAPHRPHEPATTKASLQKQRPVASKAATRFEQQAIWPIYFYGCLSDDPTCG